MEQRTYIAIDLKSFYASVECMEALLQLCATMTKGGTTALE